MAVQITWHGHSNFQIQADGINIMIDPFFSGNPKADCSWEEAPKTDLVLVTHSHDDHAGDAIAICKRDKAMLGAVAYLPRAFEKQGLPPELVLNGIGFNIGGSLEYKGARITMTEAFHTCDDGAPVGYIITLPGGFTIYHAGDTGIFRNMKTWGELYSIDLALLPCGDVFTMDPVQAALAAFYLRAKAAVPMHWGTFPVLVQDTGDFVKYVDRLAPDCRAVPMRPGETREF